jgi:hypothetical protein
MLPHGKPLTFFKTPTKAKIRWVPHIMFKGSTFLVASVHTNSESCLFA